MKYSRIFILLLVIFFLCSTFFAQQKKADSLTALLNSAEGIEKVDLFNSLADIYQFIDTHEAIEYAEKSVKLAQNISYEKGLASAYGSLGYAYINLDNSKAIKYTNKALQIRKKIDDKAGIATSLNVLGVIKYYEGDYLASIEYHLDAVKRREELGNEVRTATSYNNIALVNIALGNYDEALDYLNRALKVRISTNNKRAIGIIKTNIGEIQALKGNTYQALEIFRETLKINKELGNHKSEANSFQNIASVYRTLKEYSTAIQYYDSSLYIYYFLDEKNGIANAENGLGDIYKTINQYDSAIVHANKALHYSIQINSQANRIRALETLFKCFKEKNNYKKAFEYLSLHKTASDSIKSDDKLKKLAKIELDYKLDEIKKEQEEKLNRQKFYIYLLIIVLIFGLLILIVFIKSSKNKKLANEKLNELNKQLNEVNAAKDKFISIIAHDLRGPYQTTLGLAQVLEKDFNDLSERDKKNAIQNLNSSLKNQYNLLNELLKWAELQGGSFTLKSEQVNLHGLTNYVFSLLKISADKKNIKLVNSIDPNLIAAADKNMIYLVLRNLVSNSIKFTNRNGKVTLASQQGQTEIQIVVEDTGVGISKNDKANLFKLDTQFSNKGTSNEEGSGLGLILCKEIIEKHQGRIWVESEVNKGSKFYFTLPVVSS
jgi:signal transduction histidine kinase